MGLRNYINDLEFSREINSLPEGRWFENSDFAKSIEHGILSAYECADNGGIVGKAISPPAFISVFLLTYPICKHDKWRGLPFYESFSSDERLISNK